MLEITGALQWENFLFFATEVAIMNRMVTRLFQCLFHHHTHCTDEIYTEKCDIFNSHITFNPKVLDLINY